MAGAAVPRLLNVGRRDRLPPSRLRPLGINHLVHWVEQGYPTLGYFHEAERGGHFAAWEEPELFASEIRAAFRTLRQ